MMAEVKDRNQFMREITGQVWQRLNDAEFNYTFGEIRNHFREMMENPEVQEEVADVFYDRFISI